MSKLTVRDDSERFIHFQIKLTFGPISLACSIKVLNSNLGLNEVVQVILSVFVCRPR